MRGSCSLSTCHLHSFFILYIHSRTSSGAQGVPVTREDRALCVRVCGLPVLTTAVIIERRHWRCGETHWKATGKDWLFSHPRFLKAVFQGDGLEIVRLNLSVGGWELPLGRNAKGCLEAVKATVGEYLTKKEKGVLYTAHTIFYCCQCSCLCRCSLMWAEAKIL